VSDQVRPLSKAAVRIALTCLVLTTLSTCTIAAVDIVSYLFPRTSSDAQAVPSANSYAPVASSDPPAATAIPGDPASAEPDVGAYQAAMKTRTAAFRAAYAKLVKDSLAAEKSEWNLRWPGILQADSNAAAAAAGAIAAVIPPSSLATADRSIDTACQAVITGINAFKDGIASLSTSKSEAGYLQTAAARDHLEQALKAVGG
jgi:hypothetical protein